MRNGFTFSQVEKLNKTNSNPIQGNKPMKKAINSILIALGLAAITTESFADIGIVETSAAVNNGTGTLYVSGIGGGANPRWSGYNFGTFDLSQTPAPTLNLTNFYFENYAYNGGSVPAGGQYNNNWLDGGSTATFKLYRDSTLINTTTMRNSKTTGNNKNWDLAASGVTINLLNGLSGNGTYNLSYTIDWTYNQWSGSANVVGTTQYNSGNATFSTIPEPSSSLLMGLGLAGLVALRLSRHRA